MAFDTGKIKVNIGMKYFIFYFRNYWRAFIFIIPKVYVKMA